MRVPLFWPTLPIVAAAALCGCGTPKADVPPAQVSYQLKPMSPDEAKGVATQFLTQLEGTPKALRHNFALRHSRGMAAIKSLNDPATNDRFQADLSAK